MLSPSRSAPFLVEAPQFCGPPGFPRRVRLLTVTSGTTTFPAAQWCSQRYHSLNAMAIPRFRNP
jgi:hypothetical protein